MKHDLVLMIGRPACNIPTIQQYYFPFLQYLFVKSSLLQKHFYVTLDILCIHSIYCIVISQKQKERKRCCFQIIIRCEFFRKRLQWRKGDSQLLFPVFEMFLEW